LPLFIPIFMPMKKLCWSIVIPLAFLTGCATRAVSPADTSKGSAPTPVKKQVLPVSVKLTAPLSVQYATALQPDQYSDSKKAYAIVSNVVIKAPSENLIQNNALVVLLDGKNLVQLDTLRSASININSGKTMIALQTSDNRTIRANSADLFLCHVSSGKFIGNSCQPVISVIGTDVCLEASSRQGYRSCNVDSTRHVLLNGGGGRMSAGLSFARPMPKDVTTFAGTYHFLTERERNELHQQLPQIYDRMDIAENGRIKLEEKKREEAIVEGKRQRQEMMAKQASRLPARPVGSTDSCAMTGLLQRGIEYTDEETFDCGTLGKSIWLGSLRKAGWEVAQENRTTVVVANDREFPLKDRITLLIRKVR
jgi:hypothetical protein